MARTGDITARGPALDGLDAALASSPDAIGVRCDDRLVIANPPLAALFGWPAGADLRGTALAALIAPTSRDQLVRHDRARVTGAEPLPCQLHGLHHDGSLFPIELYATPLALDGVPHLLTLVRALGPPRAAAEVLREREAMFRALFEVNAAIKLLIDPTDGRIVDANPAAAQFYGWSVAELRTMRIHEINTLTEGQVAAELARARRQDAVRLYFRHRTRSGAIADVEIHSGPLVIDGRTLLVSIIHDVTERNQLEDQLRRGQRLEAIGRLAAGIAHDFNNILTVISASAQLAARAAVPPRVETCLADIRDASQRGATLTGHLLALGRAQALAPVAVELRTLVTRLADTLRRVLGERIAIGVELGPDLPPVVIDPAQLELTLINLALNARDAMPAGGRLDFLVGVVAPRPPTLTGEHVALVVADTGTGMDDATRARIFEPFFTTKPPGAGTGLGLALAFGFLAQSGGTITVASQPGRGSRFTLFLPVDANIGAPPPVAVVPASRFSGTVIAVDDRADVRRALVRLLEDLGFAVHAAGSVRDALTLLGHLAAPPDLILSDVTMPLRSGLDLVDDVAASWPQVPVVLMSADPGILARSPRAAGLLPKPFTVDALLALLRQVVPGCLRGP